MTVPTVDRFIGCLLGLATGDALGAPYEGGLLERWLWQLIGRTSDGSRRWTDDTQMALDLAESLLAEGQIHPEQLARRFASSYSWSRGYGAGTARVLRRIRRGEPWQQAALRAHAGGSYGNGAAMRAPVLALFFPNDREALMAAAQTSAGVTHAHPLAMEGAVLIALAAQALLMQQDLSLILESLRVECQTPQMLERLAVVTQWLMDDRHPRSGEVVRVLGNGVSAARSCPTALYLAIRHRERPFEELMSFTIRCGGDVDTIAAMAGALWGITNGYRALPQVRLEGRDRITRLASRLHAVSLGNTGSERVDPAEVDETLSPPPPP